MIRKQSFNEAEVVSVDDPAEGQEDIHRRRPKKKQGKREEDLSGLPVVVVEHSMDEKVVLQMTNEGKLLKIEAVTTISEVERRTRDLVSELQKRHIHQDVIKCCKEEYLQENYFHAIFEAAKSLSEKVREKTGMQDTVPTYLITLLQLIIPDWQ